MSCEHLHEQLNAMLDGELSPAAAATLTAHLATCPDCARNLRELAELRAAISSLDSDEVSPELEARTRALTDDPPGKILRLGPRWRQAGLIAAGAALAASLTLALRPGEGRIPDLMSVRDAALRGGLTQTADASAPKAPGFSLVGTRSDVLAGHHARVAVYMRAGSRVTLCIWPAGSEPAHAVENAVYQGMAISYWNDGHDEYWAASPAPGSVLPAFVSAL